MHAAVLDFVMANTDGSDRRVLEVGGLDVNGSVRHMFPGADYLSIDIVEGPGVDVNADFLTWALAHEPRQYDLVLCLEVFEHVEGWRQMVTESWRLLKDGGRFIGTCATNPRNPHSAYGGPDPGDEWYLNVDAGDLQAELCELFPAYTIDVTPSGDLRWVARR